MAQNDPFAELGPTLACALIAQAGNVLLAALASAQAPGGYRVRSAVFVAALLWSLAGTVVLLVRTGASRKAALKAVRPGRIALWLVSAWVWPVLVAWKRSHSGDTTAP